MTRSRMRKLKRKQLVKPAAALRPRTMTRCLAAGGLGAARVHAGGVRGRAGRDRTGRSRDFAGSRRHRAKAGRESAERRGQHSGDRQRTARTIARHEIRRLRQVSAERVVPERRRPVVRTHLHARRRERRRRQSLGFAAVGRHVSRRTAGDDDRRQPQYPHLRHRARRGLVGAARHFVRRELAGRHDPHHHQQARSEGLRRRLRPRRQFGRSRRHRLVGRGLRQPAAVGQPGGAPGRLGRERMPDTSTTCIAR